MNKITILLCSLFILSACNSASTDLPQEVTDIDQTQNTPTDLNQAQIDQAFEQAEIDTQADIDLYESRDQSNLSIDDCSDFKDDISKLGCEDQVYLDSALENKDASICESIESEELRDICEFEANQPLI